MYRNNCDSVKPSQVRKIKPTRRSVSGKLAFRGDTSIPFESTLERDFLIKAEFCLSVVGVIAQPVSIPFIGINGQTYSYTPDFLVYYYLEDRIFDDFRKPVLAEVKPEKEWRKNWRKWLPKWKAAWRYAQSQGWEFHIYDESRIRDQSLVNIRFLDRYKRMNFETEKCQAVIETVKQMGVSTPDYLLARHFKGISRAESISLIWHLLATRQLDFDSSFPLNDLSELWMPFYE